MSGVQDGDDNATAHVSSDRARPDAAPRAVSPIALHQLFRRLAGEMAALEAQSLSVEHCMTALLDGQSAAEKGAFSGHPSLQSLDRVVQTLAELQAFLIHAAEAVPDDLDLDLGEAAQRVKLRQLAVALTGTPPCPQQAPPEDGIVELF